MDRYGRRDHLWSCLLSELIVKVSRTGGCFFQKLKLHRFLDVYEVIVSEYKAQIHVHRPGKLPAVVLRP